MYTTDAAMSQRTSWTRRKWWCWTARTDKTIINRLMHLHVIRLIYHVNDAPLVHQAGQDPMVFRDLPVRMDNQVNQEEVVVLDGQEQRDRLAMLDKPDFQVDQDSPASQVKMALADVELQDREEEVADQVHPDEMVRPVAEEMMDNRDLQVQPVQLASQAQMVNQDRADRRAVVVCPVTMRHIVHARHDRPYSYRDSRNYRMNESMIAIRFLALVIIAKSKSSRSN